MSDYRFLLVGQAGSDKTSFIQALINYYDLFSEWDYHLTSHEKTNYYFKLKTGQTVEFLVTYPSYVESISDYQAYFFIYDPTSPHDSGALEKLRLTLTANDRLKPLCWLASKADLLRPVSLPTSLGKETRLNLAESNQHRSFQVGQLVQQVLEQVKLWSWSNRRLQRQFGATAKGFLKQLANGTNETNGNSGDLLINFTVG